MLKILYLSFVLIILNIPHPIKAGTVPSIEHIWDLDILKTLDATHNTWVETLDCKVNLTDLDTFKQHLKKLMSQFNNIAISLKLRKLAMAMFLNYLDLYIKYASYGECGDTLKEMVLQCINALQSNLINAGIKLDLIRLEKNASSQRTRVLHSEENRYGYRADFIVGPLHELFLTNDALPDPSSDSPNNLYHLEALPY